jgi:hypothetical protein
MKDQVKEVFKAAGAIETDTIEPDAWLPPDDPPDLASQPDILSEFGTAIRGAGVVGEEKIAKLLFLALTTRFLDRPVSVAVKGPSSGGKSYTIEETLSFFPASAYFERTAMSPRNLAYTKESFEHRFIVLFEAAGMGEDDDIGQYLIRSLLSEGRLVYEFVDSKKNATVLIAKAGPTGLIVSTTSPALHAENETRMLSVTVTDSREQTKAVMRRIAEDANGTDDGVVERKPWVDLQVWLDRAEHRVRIPFAADLADLIEPEAVRLRRDFKAVLGLIKAHAICHQVNRERDERGRILATLEDYEAVYEVVVDVVSEGIGKTVPETMRETVSAVELLLAVHPDGVPLGVLSEALKADKSTASRRARTARYGGYLVNLEDRRGHPARYKVGEPLPDPAKALPPPKSLAERHRPATRATPQHPYERNGSATPRATLSEEKSARQGHDSQGHCSVARVAEGVPEVLHSTVAPPLQGAERCDSEGCAEQVENPVRPSCHYCGADGVSLRQIGVMGLLCSSCADAYFQSHKETGWERVS